MFQKEEKSFRIPRHSCWGEKKIKRGLLIDFNNIINSNGCSRLWILVCVRMLLCVSTNTCIFACLPQLHKSIKTSSSLSSVFSCIFKYYIHLSRSFVSFCLPRLPEKIHEVNRILLEVVFFLASFLAGFHFHYSCSPFWRSASFSLNYQIWKWNEKNGNKF